MDTIEQGFGTVEFDALLNECVHDLLDGYGNSIRCVERGQDDPGRSSEIDQCVTAWATARWTNGPGVVEAQVVPAHGGRGAADSVGLDMLAKRYAGQEYLPSPYFRRLIVFNGLEAKVCIICRMCGIRESSLVASE